MRFDWADNIRFIAIISVIVVHTAATGVYLFNNVPSIDWWIANVMNSSLRFALPFFFLLSGALNINNDYDAITFYRKRFFRVFLPFVFWGILFSLGFWLYYLVNQRNVSLFSLLGDFVFTREFSKLRNIICGLFTF